MTNSLTPQERAELSLAEIDRAGLRETLDDVAVAGHVPEPSPLFWEHLSARVKEAVDSEPIPAAVSGWRAWWRPVLICSTALATITIAVAIRVMPGAMPTATSTAVEIGAVADAAAADDVRAMWDSVGAIAPSMPLATAREAGLAPNGYAAASAIEELTDSERRELVRLLRLELGYPQ